MRVRIALVLAVTLLVISVPSSEPLSAGGLAPGLCNHDATRVEIPGDFALEACFDGETLHLRNDTNLVLKVLLDGTRVDGRQDAFTPALPALAMALFTEPDILPPGYVSQISIDSAAHSVMIDGTDSNTIYAILVFLNAFLPLPEPLEVAEALYDFADEIATVTEDLRICLANSAWYADGGCWLGWGWDVNFAYSRLLLKVDIIDLGGLVGAIKAFLDTAGFINESFEDVAYITSVAKRELTIEASLDEQTILASDGLGQGLEFGQSGDLVVETLSSRHGDPGIDRVQTFVPSTGSNVGVGPGLFVDDLEAPTLVFEYPYARRACWGMLCVVLSSPNGTDWIFEGYSYSLFHSPDYPSGSAVWPSNRPEISTVDGLTVGSSFSELLQHHPDAMVSWGEGESTGALVPGWEPNYTGNLWTHMLEGRGGLIPSLGYPDQLFPSDIPGDVRIVAFTIGNLPDPTCC